MSEEATPATTSRLPWVFLGPRSQGRNYSVTALTPGVRLNRQAENRLEDFALAMAGWADIAAGRKVKGFHCCFQLGEEGPWLLARVRFMGRVGLGTVAMATAVLIPPDLMANADFRAHKLVGSLPEPSEALSIPPPLVAPVGPAQIGNAGLDRLAIALDDNFTLQVEVEDVSDVASTLDGILDYTTTSESSCGWSGTGGLSRNGAFDPATAFQLIVHAPGDAPAREKGRRVVVVVRAGSIAAGDIPDVPARLVWTALLEGARQCDASTSIKRRLESLHWRRSFASLPTDDLIRKLLAVAAEGLTNEDQIDLFGALASGTLNLDARPALQDAARAALLDVYRGYIADTEGRLTAAWLDAYLEKVSAQLGHGAPRMVTVEALRGGALPYMKPHSLLSLSDKPRGLFTAMAPRTLKALQSALVGADAPGLSDSALTALMGGMTGNLGTGGDEAKPETYEIAALLLDEAACRIPRTDVEPLEVAFTDLLGRLLRDCGDYRRLAVISSIASIAMAEAKDSQAAKIRTDWRRTATDTLKSVARAHDLSKGLKAFFKALGVRSVDPWESNS